MRIATNSVIPYFSLIVIPVGPLTIHVWGLLVALGILAGTWVAVRTGKRFGVTSSQIEEAAWWIVLAAFIGARLGHFLFYAPWSEFAHILRIWETGWSSMGGIIGAVIGFVLIRRRAFPGLSFARAADICASGFPIGMAIGRIGCFLIHDHPGIPSDSLLAVNFPDGPRFDLGLLESLAMFAIVIALACTSRRLSEKEGRLAMAIGSSYAVARFALDALRPDDVRFAGLTPAQYGCLFLLGMMLVMYLKRKKPSV